MAMAASHRSATPATSRRPQQQQRTTTSVFQVCVQSKARATSHHLHFGCSLRRQTDRHISSDSHRISARAAPSTRTTRKHRCRNVHIDAAIAVAHTRVLVSYREHSASAKAEQQPTPPPVQLQEPSSSSAHEPSALAAMPPYTLPSLSSANSPPLRGISSLLAARHPSTSTPTASKSPAHHLARSLTALLRRQTIVAIPTTYTTAATAGPPPGEVAGIVLGSVAGVLLVLWLIYTCFNIGGRGRSGVVAEEVEIQRRSSRRGGSGGVVRSRSRSEVIEVRSSPRRERRESSRRRETVVIEESRNRGVVQSESEGGDDIVEVIEEHSPPPRRERRESRRVSSGYRTVDPEAFGGGGRPIRKVSGRR